jgi:hypothetical protein
MIKIVLILLAAALLGGSAPAPVRPLAQRAQRTYQIHGTVNGFTSGGSPAPIGAFTAYGATLSEAMVNAQQLEAQVRATATAQATR